MEISFNKRAVIDSILTLAFSKLNQTGSSKQGFLRQSVTENSTTIRLLNEGVINFVTPAVVELAVSRDSYKKIGINIQSACNLTSLSGRNLIFNSNPQLKLRRGLAPEYYYGKMKGDIVKESISNDGKVTVIMITCHQPKLKAKANYTYTIDNDSNDLLQIQSYEEEEDNGDFFYLSIQYQHNELVSILSSAKQIRSKKHYSTNDELFLVKQQIHSDFPINFKPNKCGLQLYNFDPLNCEVIREYKVVNRIPAQQYF
ncbi:hypothetical protein OQX61_21170 [Pedobacter sp. PLR]|uniref:hypothetical protein n=1 Tax=Pedobacter sp. PLR TaxID=2994465 RepID=UPI002245480A|nr:hypothetical protein [Pedobacter sp. PLR]MCX2453794.1 hypothetical protein [Pedobacter sp. PLR]